MGALSIQDPAAGSSAHLVSARGLSLALADGVVAGDRLAHVLDEYSLSAARLDAEEELCPGECPVEGDALGSCIDSSVFRKVVRALAAISWVKEIFCLL